MSTFENILENLKKKYQQEYGVAVFDIEVKNTKPGIIMKGKVLTENQKDETLEEFKKNKIKIKKENIKVLSDADKRNEIGWAIARNKIIDLRSRFVASEILNDKILNRIRCSQAFRGEVLRVLYKHENQSLVQQSDLTLGWVDKKEIVINKKSLNREWKKGSFAVKGKIINLRRELFFGCHSELVSESIIDFKKNNTIQDNQKISKTKTKQSVNQGKILKQVQNDNLDSFQNKIIKEAEKYLGVKYVLGGKSKKGIDCSGLVQAAYKNSLGIILPKHSWDQKETGRKIGLKNVVSGDLIFLIKKENGHKHVGITEVCENAKRLYNFKAGTMEPVSGQSEVNLIHASLDDKKVVKQDLRKVFEKYNFVEARRVVSL